MTHRGIETPQKLAEKLKLIFNKFYYLTIGIFISSPFIFFYLLAALPFVVYRWIIKQILEKCVPRRYGYQEMVSPGFGTAFAIEYLDTIANKTRPSRNSILSSTVIQGTISYEECIEKIKSGWIYAKKIGDENKLQYPGFQCYVDSFMGYTFWRKCETFDLKSHVSHHELKSSDDLDKYLEKLFEILFNKLYEKGKSPWEVHVVHGWKVYPNSGEKLPVTVFVTWSHHILADGLSLMSAVVHGIVKRNMLDLQVVSPSLTPAQQQKLRDEKRKISYLKRVKMLLKQLVRLIYDLGVVCSHFLWITKPTRFHVSDERKSWKLEYAKSNLIPLEKIKMIREHFGVKFTGVIFSCLAAGYSRFLDEDEKSRKNFLIATPGPLPGHSLDEMVNHMSGNAYKIPVLANMNPVARLVESDRIFKHVNKSLVIYFVPFLARLSSNHVIPISRLLFRNRFFGVSLSNIPGPRIPVKMNGNDDGMVLEVNAASGHYDGVGGLAILLFSYNNNFYLNALAENACMNNEDLRIFLKTVEEELDILYELATDGQQMKRKSGGAANNGVATFHQIEMPLLNHALVNEKII